jgi:hypothetical protein
MGLLPWSFGFMLIMSILTWSAVGRMSEETLVTASIVTSVERQATELTEKISSKSASTYREYCEKEGKTLADDGEEEEGESEEQDRVKRPRSQKAKHRLTTKLHIQALFTSDDTGQKATQEKIFRNLLKELYSTQPLFTPQGNNDPYVQQLFDEVRQKAIDVSLKMPMHNAATLANIELSGHRKEEKQFILFLILKGGEGELFRGSRCYVHSLLPYVSMNKKDYCMSVYLAPLPLLMALFENVEVVKKVIESRNAMYAKIRKEKENPTTTVSPSDDKKDLLETLSLEFKTLFEASLPSGIDPQYIDFKVSGTQPRLTVRPEKRK